MCDYCELVFTCKEKLDVHAMAAHEEEMQNSMVSKNTNIFYGATYG